ncbi:ester cyclase [Celeribacter sp.]|uniref:ester cyclase n=1 Tax=Celeribacter sp. TaxID=1890673 RepID=UPI003A954D0E
MTTAAALYQAFYDRVWVQGDIDAIDDYLTNDTASKGLLTDFSANAQDVKELVLAARAMLCEIACTVDVAVDADPWYWAHVTISGRHAKTMQPTDFTAQVMGRMEDGALVEVYNTVDLLSFFEKMGSLPENATALMLSGEQFD